MRHLFHLRWLLALLFSLGSLLPARATHILGGDIAYRPLPASAAGLPRYHVTVRLFANPSTFQQIDIALLATKGVCSGNNADNFSVVIPRSQVSSNIAPGCPSTSSGYTYVVNLYETDVTLTPGQWTLSVAGENRMENIQNIVHSTGRTFYVDTFLDTSLTTADSSPAFLSTTLPAAYASATQRYSFSAFDAEGDSLAYAFTSSQELPGGLSSTSAPCGVAIAGSPSPHFTLNSRTGDLTRVPSAAQQGYFVMAARVSEYRRLGGAWQLIGYVTRDIAYQSYLSSNQPPRFSGLAVNGRAEQSPDLPIEVRPGQTVQLVLTATDPDAGQQLRFASEAPSIVPGLSLTTLSGSQAQLTWQVPATLAPGRYPIPVTVLDNGCPANASEDRTLVFVVSNRALATQPALNANSNAYPVPFREQVQFTAGPSQAVVVIDALGREVARLRATPDGRVQWHPTGLPAGLYLARTTEGQPLARLLHAE